MLDRFAISSLRAQILTRTLAVVLVPLLALAIVAVLGLRSLGAAGDRQAADSRNLLIAETVPRQLLSVAQTSAREIELILTERIRDVQGWAAQPVLVAGPSGDILVVEQFLSAELARTGDFERVLVTDDDGEPLVRVADSGADLDGHGDEEWWQQTWADGIHVGEVSTLEDEVSAGVPIAVRIDDEQDRPIGVIRAWLDAAFVAQIADAHAGDGIDITVLTSGRRILAETASGHRRERLAEETVPFAQLSQGIAEALVGETGTVEDDDGFHAFSQVATTFDSNAAGGAGHTTWHAVASQPSDAALAPLAGLARLNEDLGRAGRELILVVGIVVLFAAAVAALTARALARRIVDPIQSLTARAQRAAHTDLPEAVRSARAGAAGADPETAGFELVSAADSELRQLADAFNSVQETAIRLASEQAEQRRETAAMFANLGRRSQSLVQRQLSVIDQLEGEEHDAERRSALFKLDHLATRMRRNAESLLVIAGQRASSGRAAPVRLELVVHRAIGEVEDYERIDQGHIEPTALLGQVATDVAHLLAELLDNALAFSPPEATVTVSGMRAKDKYLLSVVDRGIGLTPDELAATNERLEAGTALELGSSRKLGLLVVARLAERHGIRVRLQAAEERGTVALVVLPDSLLRPLDDVLVAETADRPPPGHRRRDDPPPPNGSAAPAPTPPATAPGATGGREAPA